MTSRVLCGSERIDFVLGLEKGVEKVADVNKRSQSNESLMRATPMAVYCSNCTENEIFEYTKTPITISSLSESFEVIKNIMKMERKIKYTNFYVSGLKGNMRF